MEQSIPNCRLYLFFYLLYHAVTFTRKLAMNINQSRHIEQLIEGIATSDGAGVKLTRVLTGKLQRRLDPFLMLDAFGSYVPDDYIAGFPDHPHRGFETVTYMLSGRMRHRDSAGNEGLLDNGGVQWMTAGRGVIHSEMPEQIEGVMEGFQLWINLPAKHKMDEPWYRDFASESIPEYITTSGARVRVIAGTSGGVEGVITRQDTEPLFLDVHLPAGASFQAAIPGTHNAFIYVYRGEVVVGDTQVGPRRMGILSTGADGVTLTAATDARLILLAGRPLNEPIVQYGPFVMNTQEEIHQALDDFRSGHFV
jgi:redox-sensitive bicupin YhaK (pirin superfamily)